MKGINIKDKAPKRGHVFELTGKKYFKIRYKEQNRRKNTEKMEYFKIINIWITKEGEKPQTRKDMYKHLTNC